jgi:peroxiredoxin
MTIVDWRGEAWSPDDHLGRPVVLLFHRHFACEPCKAYAVAVRHRLDELGDAEVVVVVDGPPRTLAGYRTRFVAPLAVVTDEARALHRTFGFGMGDDGVPVGGVVVLGRDGAPLLVHPTASAEDRPAIDDLIALVRLS